MFLKQEEIKNIKEFYKEGMVVEMVSMVDDPRPIPPGTLGTVKFVDDAGQIHVSWTTGSSLAAVPGIDYIRPMSERVVVRRPNGPFCMKTWELAGWANAVHHLVGGKGNPFSSEFFPERLKGYHCSCGVTKDGYTKGEFRLLPLDSEENKEGGKAYMRCEKCGGYSHL